MKYMKWKKDKKRKSEVKLRGTSKPFETLHPHDQEGCVSGIFGGWYTVGGCHENGTAKDEAPARNHLVALKQQDLIPIISSYFKYT